MTHRGEIVKKAIQESGYPVTKVAERLKKSRRWVYLMYENPNVNLEVILEIGKIINHDFSGEIKNLKMALSEPESKYESQGKNAEYWRDKYYALLEEHHELLKQMKDQEKS